MEEQFLGQNWRHEGLVAQAKVLSALQRSRVSPVGSDKEIKVDVRVVAATNKNIQKEMKDGKF